MKSWYSAGLFSSPWFTKWPLSPFGGVYGEKKFTRRSPEAGWCGGVCTCKIKKISLIFTRILFSILKKGPLDVCPYTSHFLSIFSPQETSPVNGHTKHDMKACTGQNLSKILSWHLVKTINANINL